MGATVTTGKAVSAFKGIDGNVYYALFEQAYDKNCHPHTPTWSCVLLGTVAQALRWIFLAASSCESGMLQGRGGSLTPVGYIDGWLKQLANPAVLPDQVLWLQIGENFSATIPKVSEKVVLEMLTQQGYVQEAEQLAKGESINFRLYDKPLLLSTLYGGTLGAWRLLSAGYRCEYGPRDPELGYRPAPCTSFEVAVPAFYKVDRNNRLVMQADGTWRCKGWQYSIVGSYICSLWEAQLQEPGSYRKRIKAFREAIDAAPMIPAGTKIEVDLSVPLSSYQRDTVERLQKELPHTTTESGYVIDVPTDHTALHHACALSSKCARWIVPTHGDFTDHQAHAFEQLALV